MYGNGDISKLSGPMRKKIRQAIISAYPNPGRLKIMVNEQLGENLQEIAGEGALDIVVDELIDWAKSRSKVEELVEAARRGNPDNEELKNLEGQLCAFSPISNAYSSYPISINKWKDLRSILDGIKLDNESKLKIFSNVCYNTLDNIAKNKDVSGNYTELNDLKNLDILEDIFLKKCTHNDIGVPTIIEFAERLTKEKEIKGQDEDLIEKWLEDIKKTDQINRPAYQENNSSAFSQYYLVVTAEPTGNNKFELEAELIKKSDNKNYEKKYISCELSEIASKLYDFIKEYRERELKPRYNDYTLTIELFMPLNHLDASIDIQELEDKLKGKIAFGEKYQLIVRCIERVQLEDGEYLMKMRKKWNGSINKFDYIPPPENNNDWDWSNLKELACCWDKNDNKISGVNITSGLPENDDTKRKFFLSIIYAGVPICLWTRGNNLTGIKEFKEICSSKFQLWNDSERLFELVHEIRKEGHHLGFLCDHPDRIPLRIDPETPKYGEMEN
jgi:hypothetical protein